jgi:hypothetical protein
MSDGPLLSAGLEQLRAEGFYVSPDKLHRFRCFGVSSTRDGRLYRISPQALADLRYILQIERTFQLSRDHDGLCLELATRSYPTVPWRRVHEGARKGVASLFAIIDRELHRANDWSGIGFHPRRIPHLARQLANHFIPKSKIAVDPAYGIAWDLVELCLQMLLRVAYNDEPFNGRDVRRLLMMLRMSEKEAMDLSAKAMPLLAVASPMIRMNHKNLFQATLKSEPDVLEVQAAVRTVRTFPKFFDQMKAAGVQVTIPPVEDYPTIEENDSANVRVSSALRSVAYATAFDINRYEDARRNVKLYQTGEANSPVDNAINQLGATFTMLPKVIGLPDATK